MVVHTAEHVVKTWWAAAKCSPPARLAEAISAVATLHTGSSGAGLGVLFGADMSVPLGASDQQAALADCVHFTTGQGPTWQALTSSRIVRVGDITDDHVCSNSAARSSAGPCPERVTQRPDDLLAGEAAGQAVGLVAALTTDPEGGHCADVTAAPDPRLWRTYSRALAHQTDYRAVLAIPVRLANGLLVVLTLYSDQPHPRSHDLDTGVLATGLAQVLEAASMPGACRESAWLDTAASLRRAAVWVAEMMLMDAEPRLDHSSALRVMRAFCLAGGRHVDDVAADVVEGRLQVAELLSRC